jgi:hypothetical protein
MEINITISEVHIHINEPADELERKEFGHGYDWQELLKYIKLPGQVPEVKVVAPEVNKVAQEVNNVAPDADQLKEKEIGTNVTDETVVSASLKVRNGGVKKGDKAKTGMKNCEVCGKEYKPTVNVQKFCGDACKHEHKLKYGKDYYARTKEAVPSGNVAPDPEENSAPGAAKYEPMIGRVCRICGGKFDAKRYNEWYCSDDCRHKRNVKQMNEFNDRKRLETKKEKLEFKGSLTEAEQLELDGVLQEIENNKRAPYTFGR